MKILISTSSFNTESAYYALLLEKGFQAELNPFKRKLSEKEIIDFLPGIDGLIAGVEPLNKEVLSSTKSLKVISRCGTGMDSVDVEAAKELGIKVFNTPDAVTQCVAELTVGLILNVLRHVSLGDRLIRSGQWKKHMGNLLFGKTVGLLGLGRIGKRVVELLQPFGVKYIARDIAPDISFAEEHGVKIGDIDDVLRESDVVSIHLPYFPELDHFISDRELGLMKKESILINASRGKLIDEDALCRALSEKMIAGAAIDTFENEPYVGPLKNLDNVVLTPHIGSYAIESRIRMERESVENLIEGFRKLELIQ